jgi:aminoglycoside phosphotransferase (APT) family kinase protein
VNEVGPLLAAGRDAEIFAYGDGLVLRRARDGRSLAGEAEIQAHLHAHGFPVPEVHDLLDDGRDLVMERVEGPTMVDAVARRPWTLRRRSHELADLHHRLHELDAPAFLSPSPVGDGDAVLHLDLHPLNVLLGPRGPVVIDWTGACRGHPDVDVVLAWVLMSVGQLPGGGPKAAIVGAARRVGVAAFLERFDRRALAARCREVVAWKATDANMSPGEVEAMWALVERAERARRGS